MKDENVIQLSRFLGDACGDDVMIVISSQSHVVVVHPPELAQPVDEMLMRLGLPSDRTNDRQIKVWDE